LLSVAALIACCSSWPAHGQVACLGLLLLPWLLLLAAMLFLMLGHTML
jgi:hypothetical protein